MKIIITEQELTKMLIDNKIIPENMEVEIARNVVEKEGKKSGRPVGSTNRPPWFSPKGKLIHNYQYEFNGKKQSLKEWSKDTGVSPTNLCHRITNGWSLERAFTTPVSKNWITKRKEAETDHQLGVKIIPNVNKSLEATGGHGGSNPEAGYNRINIWKKL